MFLSFQDVVGRQWLAEDKDLTAAPALIRVLARRKWERQLAFMNGREPTIHESNSAHSLPS